MAQADPSVPHITLVSDWLRDRSNAGLDAAIAKALADVSREVHLLDKSGSVTVEFKIARNGRRVVVQPTIKVKAPNAPEESSLWFVDEHGLAKDDPYYLTFDDVDGAGLDLSDPRSTADPTTGEIPSKE